MEEYKSNSHKSKEQQGASGSSPKKIDGVISGSASRKKRSEAKKFADVFIQEDVSNVKSYILMDVLVPAVKKALSDIVKDGVDMILYGETNRNRKNGNTSRVNYRGYYDREERRDRPSSRGRDYLDYDEIIFDARGDAGPSALHNEQVRLDQYRRSKGHAGPGWLRAETPQGGPHQLRALPCRDILCPTAMWAW